MIEKVVSFWVSLSMENKIALLGLISAIGIPIIVWIYKFFTKEKLKINSFRLKLNEEWEDEQAYRVNNNHYSIKSNYLEQNLYFPPMFHYSFPEFDVVLKNNTDDVKIMENLRIR